MSEFDTTERDQQRQDARDQRLHDEATADRWDEGDIEVLPVVTSAKCRHGDCGKPSVYQDNWCSAECYQMWLQDALYGPSR